MRALVFLALLLGAPAFAQAPRVGPLDARNNLGEIAAGGSGAQASARANLGLSGVPVTVPTTPLLGGTTGAFVSVGIGCGASGSGNTLVVQFGTVTCTALQGSLLGAANGVAGLDGGSHVPLGQLPTIPTGQISGLAPSATTDTTNATNITTGTLPAGPLTGANASGANVTATSGPTTRTAADHAADVLNVKDFGAKGNGVFYNTADGAGSATVSLAASSAALTVGSSLFSAADVGKVIVIGQAGVSPTVGGIINVPVATPGAGYTAVPSCVFPGPGPGSGAICLPQMKVMAAAQLTPGSGCVNSGTQTFLVSGGQGRWATVTGTVTSGALVSGSLTVVDGGFFSVMPPVLAGAFLSGGGGCTVYPTVTLSMGVSKIALGAWGSGYTIAGGATATLSGGSPTTAATLGTATVYAPIPPLVTTISGYSSPTQVTLAAAAATTAPSSAPLFWATDDYTAIQAALTAGQRRAVRFPDGNYFSGTALNPGAGPITIRADGMYAANVVFDGMVTHAFANSSGSPTALKSSIQFEDIGIRGLLDFGEVGASGTGGLDAITLLNYSELDFDRIHVSYTPAGAASNEAVAAYRVTDSTLEYILSVGMRCRSCSGPIIKGNHYRHVGDDSVDHHQANFIQGPGVIRQGLVIEGNTFEDAVGIHLLGARQAIVANNTCRRCQMYLLSIDQDAHEGVNPMFDIDVHDNSAEDTIGRPPFNGSGSIYSSQSVIGIGAIAPLAGPNDPALVPGTVLRQSGAIVPPYSYYDNSISNTFDATVMPLPPGQGIMVHHNRIMRTRPAVEAYSSLGFGTPISEQMGLGLDVPVTDAGMRPVAGISVSFNGLGTLVDHNYVQGVYRGIVVNGTAVGPTMSQWALDANIIYDAIEYGIFLTGMSNENQGSITNNWINSDPYRVSAGRADTNGGWTSGFSDNFCISGSGGGTILQGNRFAECYQIQTGGSSTQGIDNFYYGAIAAAGSWNAFNRGIGVPPLGGSGFHWLNTVVTPSTPSGYGALAAGHLLEAGAAPTSGSHLQGEFIRSTNPTGCTCQGWAILTTGTTWTSGTDYKVVPIQ